MSMTVTITRVGSGLAINMSAVNGLSATAKVVNAGLVINGEVPSGPDAGYVCFLDSTGKQLITNDSYEFCVKQ